MLFAILAKARSGLPSPSKSATTALTKPSPRVIETGEASEGEPNFPPLLKVRFRAPLPPPVKPATVTWGGAKVAPGGTAISSESVEAPRTGARTAPRYTIFASAMTLKLFPWRVTRSPVDAARGEIEVTTGTIGSDWTSSVTGSLSLSPKRFLIITEYAPACSVRTSGRVSEAFVAFGMGIPPRDH